MYDMSQSAQILEHKHIHFHKVCGKDVVFYNSRSVAKRSDYKDSGLVFTSRPVKINERIFIKLIAISEDIDILNVGFTSKDPSTLSSDLSQYSCQDLQHRPDHWICRVRCLPEKRTVRNTILFFYVNKNGTVYYGIDDEEKGSFDKKITTSGRLWALIDIQSVSTTIQLIDNFKCDLQPLILHQTRGRNVKLIKNKAYKADENLETSYAFTARPLAMNERVVIKILGVNRKSIFTLGLTACNPSFLQPNVLPDTSQDFVQRKEYWLLVKDPSWNLKKHDEISFFIKTNAVMEIIKNRSTILKMVRVNINTKLWALFDFGHLKGIEVVSCVLGVGDIYHQQPELPSAPPMDDVNNEFSSKEDSVQHTNVGRTEEDISECIICCESCTEAALYPCGHMCMCYECAQKQWHSAGHCPLCRIVITDVLKIFKS